MWYIFAIFTVVSTVLWGRLYCGRICAFGALTQLMDATLPSSFRVEPPAWLERRAGMDQVRAAGRGPPVLPRDQAIDVYRYVEPFWMFGLAESPVLWVVLAAAAGRDRLRAEPVLPVPVSGRRVARLLSNLTVFRIKRWSECKTCKICEKTCEWGAIQGPKIIKSECVRCDDCERLYMDQKKCPHWLIIIRKGQKRGSRRSPNACRGPGCFISAH